MTIDGGKGVSGGWSLPPPSPAPGPGPHLLGDVEDEGLPGAQGDQGQGLI